MLNKNIIPQDQVFWYLKKTAPKQLRENITTDIVIVGGGMAGLSAAQNFRERGRSVVLLEKNYCGAGASGKSSGFITPDSEYNLTHFNHLFGPDNAKKLWGFVCSGVEFIRNNIKKYDLYCDYQEQDCLITAHEKRDLSQIKTDHETRLKLGYESTFYESDELGKILGSKKYCNAMRYSGTFGINTYLYCQAMKEILEKQNVQIFEETPVIQINTNNVQTPTATIQADKIIVCVDRFAPNLNKLTQDIYHAQTFLMMSAPLRETEIKKIFPEKNLMVWDTDLIYQYYRITPDNRFMIGGSNLLSIFWGKEQHNNRCMFKKLQNYTKKKFPDVSINFEYFWPGLIGVSKDILPIADYDKTSPNIYYISGAAGLPWAAALGRYAAEKIIDGKTGFDTFFSRTRKFPVGNTLGRIMGKRATFAVSNLMSLYK